MQGSYGARILRLRSQVSSVPGSYGARILRQSKVGAGILSLHPRVSFAPEFFVSGQRKVLFLDPTELAPILRLRSQVSSTLGSNGARILRLRSQVSSVPGSFASAHSLVLFQDPTELGSLVSPAVKG